MVALVNGQPIYKADLEKQVSQFARSFAQQGMDLQSEEGRKTLEQLRRQVLEGLIEQVIIEQAAAEMGITVEEQELEEHIRQAISQGGGEAEFRKWLEANGLTEEDFRRMTRAQLLTEKVFEKVAPTPPETMEQVRVRHILVESEEEARQLVQQLKQGADFATLAKEHSKDVFTRDNGGDLGFFPRGLSGLPPEVEKVAFSLDPGQVSEVKSYFGYHVIQVVEKDSDRPLSDEMKRLYRERGFRKWLEERKSAAQIQRFLK